MLILNKAGAAERKHVFFINADREYREGKAQNHLRPEDMAKIVHVYRQQKNEPGYARRVPVTEIAAEDYNCNIRRYVDNAPPPEPHDVKAHLQGGVPTREVDALQHHWTNYPGLRELIFVSRAGKSGVKPDPQAAPSRRGSDFTPDNAYVDFTAAVTERRALADLVKTAPGVRTAQAAFIAILETWWTSHLPHVKALAPVGEQKGNVYELRRLLLASITQKFADQTLLNAFQVRGALARYFEFFKPEFKSIAFSGWGPELIPDDEILQSQFPDVLAQMESHRNRLAELAALFAAAEEEDYDDSDDTGVLPSARVKELKAELKELKARARQAKKDGEKGDWFTYTEEAKQIETQLARHKELETEERTLKTEIKATEKRQDDLVIAARAKINGDEAKRVILERLHTVLVSTYKGYLRADQRSCVAALENLHAKYAVTARDIEAQRDAVAAKLNGFLKELRYE